MYNTIQQKTLYICDLQYTRNTVIKKDWTYDEINPHAKRYKKIFHCNDTTRKLWREGDSLLRKKTKFLKWFPCSLGLYDIAKNLVCHFLERKPSYSIKSPLSSSKTAVFYYLEQPVFQIESLSNRWNLHPIPFQYSSIWCSSRALHYYLCFTKVRQSMRKIGGFTRAHASFNNGEDCSFVFQHL